MQGENSSIILSAADVRYFMFTAGCNGEHNPSAVTWALKHKTVIKHFWYNIWTPAHTVSLITKQMKTSHTTPGQKASKHNLSSIFLFSPPLSLQCPTSNAFLGATFLQSCSWLFAGTEVVLFLVSSHSFHPKPLQTTCSGWKIKSKN